MKSISRQIIETYKKHLDIGLNIGSEGNISMRENQKIHITPSGIDIKNLREEHISIVDLNGIKKNKIKPSSEVDLHLMLYQQREDVGAVVHCHSDWASILSCLRKNILQFNQLIEAIESMTGKEMHKKYKQDFHEGINEIDLVRSGLDDMMIDGFQQVKDVAINNKLDFRTAAFKLAIDKIAMTYDYIGL